MDITTILIIFVAGLVAIGLTVFMLNRAWGDFPRRPGPPDYPAPPAPRPSSPAAAPAPAAGGAADEDDGTALPAGAPEADLVPVTDPLVRQAVERAMERAGSPYAAYFIRHGDQLYLAAHRIADPMQRSRIVRVFQGINSGDMSGVNIAEAIAAIQRLGK